MTTWKRWFSGLVWLGVVLNVLLALPALVAPNALLERLGLPIADPSMWPSFSALLLCLLSAFYIPAARDVERYRANAWLAVAARLAGTVFFLATPLRHTYALFGLLDLSMGVPQLVALLMLVRTSGTQPASQLARVGVSQ